MTLLIERHRSRAGCGRCRGAPRGLPWLVWLDSAADPTHLGRWSFISAHPWKMLRAHGARTEHARRAAGNGRRCRATCCRCSSGELAPLALEAPARCTALCRGRPRVPRLRLGTRPRAPPDRALRRPRHAGRDVRPVRLDHRVGSCRWLRAGSSAPACPLNGSRPPAHAAMRAAEVRALLRSGSGEPPGSPRAPPAGARVPRPPIRCWHSRGRRRSALRSTFTDGAT